MSFNGYIPVVVTHPFGNLALKIEKIICVTLISIVPAWKKYKKPIRNISLGIHTQTFFALIHRIQ